MVSGMMQINFRVVPRYQNTVWPCGVLFFLEVDGELSEPFTLIAGP